MVVDLATHAANIDIDDICRGIEMKIPDVLQQHCPRYDAAFIAHHIFQKLEFPRKKKNVLTAPARSPRHQVDGEIADAHDGFLGGDVTASRVAVVLVDSTGKFAARPLSDNIMLVAAQGGDVEAPALIRPIYDDTGREASGMATWQAGGSVLFTSPDCTTGAHVHSSPHAGVRATAQVETPAGVVLYVGIVGTSATAVIHSILYGNGCTPVTVQQGGLVAVEATVNLTLAFPPPLSFR